MTLWASADLLAKCKMYARRPATDQAMPDASWYAFLTESQSEVYPDLFTRRPDLGYGAPVLMTTADSGATYTFGTDAETDLIRPMGHAQIYPSLRSIPDDPLVPGDDFIYEGSKIRMPNNRTRTFSAGPYARFVLRPDVAISASVQPLLYPKNARMLLVWKALESWASRPGSGASPDYYSTRYDDALTKILTEFATEYNQQTSQGAGGSSRWWSSGDLLRAGQFNG